MKIATFGALGFATMTSATLGDALALAMQMAPLGCTAEGLRLVVEDGVASVMLEEYADFSAVRDVITMARPTGLATPMVVRALLDLAAGLGEC